MLYFVIYIIFYIAFWIYAIRTAEFNPYDYEQSDEMDANTRHRRN